MKFVSLLIFFTIASQVLSVLFRDSVGVAKKHREEDVKCRKVPIKKCAEKKIANWKEKDVVQRNILLKNFYN